MYVSSCAVSTLSLRIHWHSLIAHPSDVIIAATQAKMVESAKAKGGKEIPVPKVTRVPSYNTDYLPTFREPNTYIRGRGRA